MDMEDLDLVYIEEYRAALVIVDNMLVRRKWKYLATVKIDNHVIYGHNFHHRRTTGLSFLALILILLSACIQDSNNDWICVTLLKTFKE